MQKSTGGLTSVQMFVKIILYKQRVLSMTVQRLFFSTVQSVSLLICILSAFQVSPAEGNRIQ